MGNTMSDNLPPLPYPKYGHLPDGKNDAAYAAFSEQQMQAYARSALAQAQSCVPAGWAVVPIEPTGPMFGAAESAMLSVGNSLGRFGAKHAAYAAMLAASPQPQPVQPERVPLTASEIAGLWDDTLFHITDLSTATDFVRDVEAAHGIAAPQPKD